MCFTVRQTRVYCCSAADSAIFPSLQRPTGYLLRWVVLGELVWCICLLLFFQSSIHSDTYSVSTDQTLLVLTNCFQMKLFRKQVLSE